MYKEISIIAKELEGFFVSLVNNKVDKSLTDLQIQARQEEIVNKLGQQNIIYNNIQLKHNAYSSSESLHCYYFEHPSILVYGVGKIVDLELNHAKTNYQLWLNCNEFHIKYYFRKNYPKRELLKIYKGSDFEFKGFLNYVRFNMIYDYYHKSVNIPYIASSPLWLEVYEEEV